MRIALVHPYFAKYGGSEKVVDILGRLFPDADPFALFSDEHAIPNSLRNRTIRHSFLQSVPGISTVYRGLFPLFPYAVENLDFRGYDLVISSDHGPMKGILLGSDTKHICYCHTPWRQLYDLYNTSLEKIPALFRPAFGMTAHHLRLWDFVAAQRVHRFVVNSQYIQRRLYACYRRDSEVVYPPVDTSRGVISVSSKEYYLCVGRLSHTKRLDILVQACNRLNRQLLISGEGPEERRLKAIAGPTISFLGRVPDGDLPTLYANCRALLFAADEDFGIVPVEAQASGRPVVAYGHGGSRETVRVNDVEGRSDTGIFFAEQSVESAIEGIQSFEAREHEFVPEDIQCHARQFDVSIFAKRIQEVANAVLHSQ